MRGKKAILNVITNLFLQLIIFAYGFILPKVIISNFGSSVNGLVTSITQFLGYISLLESGFGPVVKALLYAPISKKDNKSIANILRSSEKFFRTIALVFLGYIVVLALLYPILVANEFSYIYTLSLIVIISISTFFEYYFGMTYRLYLQAEQNTYIISIVQIVVYIISISLIIVLVKLNCSIHLVKLFSGLIFILKPLFINWYVKRKYKIDLREGDSKYKIAQKWDGLAQHVATVIHVNTDTTILLIFSNMKEISVYSVYYLVIKGIKTIVQTFSDSFDSTFGDMIAKNENSNLNKKFSLYEIIYLNICVVFYVCAMLLIVSFVKVYTFGVSDVNYIRPLFGILLVVGEMIWAIRQPYNILVKAGGFFKETKRGAWLEAIINIIISIIFVRRFGIVGVAIGTIVAMLFRTVELIIFATNKILKRDILNSIKKICVVILESLIILIIYNIIPHFAVNNYLLWLVEAMVVFGISCFICVLSCLVFYRKELNSIIDFLKHHLVKKKSKEITV